MKKSIFLFSVLATAIACNPKTANVIQIEEGNDISVFADGIKEVELIPLSTDATHLLGSQTNLILTENGYVVIDTPNSKIYHYNHAGEFINTIGRKGRGPGEYNTLLNAEISGDSLFVFSAPQKMQCFRLDGKLLSEKKLSSLGKQTYIFHSDTLNYYDFSPTKKDRLVVTGRTGERKHLRTTTSVLPYDMSSPRFSSNGSSVFLIDSYSTVIYQYINHQLTEHLKFDFGKYSIPEAFFSAGDPYKAATILLESDFAAINRYIETPEIKIVEVMMQSNGDLKFTYGLYNQKWIWFDCNGYGEVLKESIKTANGKTLFALLDPSMLLPFAESRILDKVTNKETLKHISENDNYVIAKIELK